MNTDERFLVDELFVISDLIFKYKLDQITSEEEQLLKQWVNRSHENEQFFNRWVNNNEIFQELDRYEVVTNRMAALKDKMLHQFFEQRTNRRRFYIYRIISAVAAMLILMFGVMYFVQNSKSPKNTRGISTAQGSDVAPGQQQAKLTLSNGTVVVLQKSNDGVLAKENGSVVMISKDGQLVYQSTEGPSGVEPLYNILSTGRGEMFSTILADGTTIWLNAGSSIRYPLAFTGNERTVELAYGEAYFDVAPGKKPFIVKSAQGQIQVLGTKFNFRCHKDEKKTIVSLLEGKVKLSHEGNDPIMLAPGEQSTFNRDSKRLSATKANVAGAISWVRGVLHFDKASLSEVLREIGRWYDVEIVYYAKANEIIEGDLERNIPLSEVLEALEGIAHVQFKIEGKKIIVLP